MKEDKDVKPYTKKELAGLYGLSQKSFYSLFKSHESKVGKKHGRYYSPKQVAMIFRRLGKPTALLKDEFTGKD
jgi:hypothetical protein